MKYPVKSDWQDCPAEAIAGLISENERQSRRAAIKRVVVASAVGFAGLGGAAMFWASRPPSRKSLRDTMIMPISCRAAISLLPELHNNRLCDSVSRRVRHHLKLCDHCLAHYHLHYHNPVV